MGPNEKPRIFISYSRKDGEAFAVALRKKLEDENLSLWQDRDQMEGGVGWWNQITEALERVTFMVLVATPEAMASPIVRKEWRYARQQGVCVYPVQVPDKPIDFAALPKWMRDSHFYDLDHEWETFLNYLKSPCNAVRVPFMAPDLPEHFVQRPAQFNHLKQQLLDANFDNPVAITTALRGAGGFGKTTLACALCHDEDVQTAFDEGVLWVTLGETPNLVNALTVLYRALTDENPGFVDVNEGSIKLSEKLVEADVLLVIDDVWKPEHLRPFLRGGEQCARLVTTRFSNIAVEANADLLEVDEMTSDESVQMLLAGIAPPADLTPFREMAARLGEWALMLEVANGMLRKRMAMQATLESALGWLNDRLDDKGVNAIKRGRKDFAADVLNTSFAQLDDDDQPPLFELAVFAEDTDIPLTALMALWDTDSSDADELAALYDDLSFVRYNAELGTIRLHDVVREVLAGRIGGDVDRRALHQRLIANLDAQHGLRTLPDTYCWRYIAYHLEAAGLLVNLRDLLLDVDFLHAKLVATDPNALLDDCDYLPDDAAVKLVKSAVSMTSHFVGDNPDELPSQLYGRLMFHREAQPAINALLSAIATHDTLPAQLAQQQTLPAAGGPLLRTFTGHRSTVNAVAFSSDGATALSAAGSSLGSSDNTLKLWDVAMGQAIRTFTGHTDWVSAVAFSPNGATAISTSADKTLKLWDVVTGTEIQTFEGHTHLVTSVAFSPDGMMALSASRDNTLKLWDVASGQAIRTFTGHTSDVNAVAFSPDSRTALSASSDRTLKQWDIASGQEIRTFIGHELRVLAVTFSPNGKTALSASNDTRLKLWDIGGGQEIRTFEGHTDQINAVAFSPDGMMALSASSDNTLKLWDVATGQAIRTFEGDTGQIKAVAFSPDGMTALSASRDRTLKLWDVANEQEIRTATSHMSRVSAVVLSLDGQTALSAFRDGTLKVWDVATGKAILEFVGHVKQVIAIAFGPDGMTALSASRDRTLKLWDVATGDILEDLPYTTEGEVRLWAQYRVTLHTKASNQDLHVQPYRGRAVQLWQRDGTVPLLTFTVDSGVIDVAVNGRGQVVVASDKHVHVLHPNVALQRLLGLAD